MSAREDRVFLPPENEAGSGRGPEATAGQAETRDTKAHG
jgi:hypothetical protein